MAMSKIHFHANCVQMVGYMTQRKTTTEIIRLLKFCYIGNMRSLQNTYQYLYQNQKYHFPGSPLCAIHVPKPAHFIMLSHY